MTEHHTRVERHIDGIAADAQFRALTQQWLIGAIGHNYAQNFTWLGRPIIQVPQDQYAIQELIWRVQPDLVIETGIAHGGSLILSASLLALLDYCEAAATGGAVSVAMSRRRVIGIDIDIRAHNRAAIEAHPLSPLIELVEGSSVDADVVDAVHARASGFKRVMVFLDSNHTHDHVLAELHAYAPLTSRGSYCVVWDSGVEDLPDGFVTDRPWGKGNNPKTALMAYLAALQAQPQRGADGAPLIFEIDKRIEHKIAITAAADGFLRRVE